MDKAPPCPRCHTRWPDEYTHHDCPDGLPKDAHRHWVCIACDHEWVEALKSTGTSAQATVSTG